MVDEEESAALFSQHDDGSIGEVELLGAPGSPFTDDDAHDHTLDGTNLDSIFENDHEDEEQPLPSLNSPLSSPPRSTNSSVGSASGDASLGLPGNEIVEEDWRNDAFDLRARKDILLQIVKILHARKQNPTSKWLGDLPYKARKLEEQLYQGASSLDDYSDKRTLKHRLKRVARAIKARHRTRLADACSSPTKSPTKRRSSKSSLSNTSSDLEPLRAHGTEHEQCSVATSPSSRRSSMIASELASLQALVNEQRLQQHKMPSRSSNAPRKISPSDLASLQTTLASPSQQQLIQRGNNVVTPHSGTSPSIASELAALRAMNNSIQQRSRQTQQQRSLSMAVRNSNNADLAALMNGDGHIHPGRIQGSNSRRNSLPSPSSNLADRFTHSQQQQRHNASNRRQESVAERQAANQKLQEQILDNIRQQQQLMRELMVGKSQNMTMTPQQNRVAPTSIRLGMPHDTTPKTSNSTSSLAQSLLNSRKASQLLNNHRQLPMDLLQQSLARADSSTERALLMQQQRRNSNYHPSMPPASNHSFSNGLPDQMSPNSFRW